MSQTNAVRIALRVVSLLAALALASSCDDDYSRSLPAGNGNNTGDEDRIQGESAALGGANVNTWGTLDDNNRVTQVGFTLPLASVRNVQASAEITPVFPAQVREQTFFNHVQLSYLPEGDLPSLFGVPHFDVHFQGITNARREAIDCLNEPIPATDDLPPGYIVPSTSGVPGTCIPRTGVRASAPDSPEVSRAPGFESTLAVGYTKGELIFLEVLVTKDFLLSKADLDLEVPAPIDFARETRWPTKLTGRYDATSDSYTLLVSDFVDVFSTSAP